jgi:hypothetical protein
MLPQWTDESYDMCLTDISSKNPRSRKAHERAGSGNFSFFDEAAQDTWELILWIMGRQWSVETLTLYFHK